MPPCQGCLGASLQDVDAGEARSNPHTCAIPPVIIKVLTDDKIARVAKFKIHSRYGYAGLSSH
jgi:hypothetical protein